jgi:hypothetical protein
MGAFFFLFQSGLRTPSEPRRLARARFSVSEPPWSQTERTSTKLVRLNKSQLYQVLVNLSQPHFWARFFRQAYDQKNPKWA